jgi:hypothetical protein
MLEDMMTFLVQFGFKPGYVLSRDVLTFNALYSSAMRCHYQDRIEEANLLVSAVAQGGGNLKKGSKPPVGQIIKAWRKIVERDGDAKVHGPGPKELMADLKSGWKNLLPKKG